MTLDINAEYEKQLRKLTLVSKLERLAESEEEREWYTEQFMKVTAWLVAHGVDYYFNHDQDCYVQR